MAMRGARGWWYGSWWGWEAMVLSQMEQTPLFNSCNFADGNIEPANSTVYLTIISSYLCPSDDSFKLFDNLTGLTCWGDCGANYYGRIVTAAGTNYVGNLGDNRTGNPAWDQYSGDPVGRLSTGASYGCGNSYRGMFGDCSDGIGSNIAKCTDGTSNTLFVGESSPNYNGSLAWVNGNQGFASTVVPLNWRTNLKDGEIDTDGKICSMAYNLSISRAPLLPQPDVHLRLQVQAPRRRELHVLRRLGQIPQADDQLSGLQRARVEGRRRGHLGRLILIRPCFPAAPGPFSGSPTDSGRSELFSGATCSTRDRGPPESYGAHPGPSRRIDRNVLMKDS